MNATIRTATAQDAETIATIYVRTARASYRGILPDAHLDALSITDRAAEIEAFMAAWPSAWRMWLAEVDRRTAAFCHSRPVPDAPGVAEVDSLYVERTAQRRGIGRELLQHAVDDLRARGYVSVILWTTERNAPARAFYERLGWTLNGAQRAEMLAGEQVVEIRYALDLAV